MCRHFGLLSDTCEHLWQVTPTSTASYLKPSPLCQLSIICVLITCGSLESLVEDNRKKYAALACHYLVVCSKTAKKLEFH